MVLFFSALDLGAPRKIFGGSERVCDGRVQVRVRRGPISNYVRSRRPTAPVVVLESGQTAASSQLVRFPQQPRLGTLRQSSLVS